MDFIVENLSIFNCFDAIVIGEDVTNGKPAPDTFLKAAEKLSLEPKCCVVVEDAVQGVQAGKTAGMAVIAVTTTRKRIDLKQADMIVDSLDELKSGDFIKLLED
jgi:beta-phosphoglucomutase